MWNFYRLGHVNNIPTMQFFTGISRIPQSKSYMLSLTESVWDFQYNALWDTHAHALFCVYSTYIWQRPYLQYLHLTETLSTVLTSDWDPGSALSGASVSMSSYTVIVLIFSLCVLYSQHVSVTFRCDRVPTSIIQLSTSLEPAVYDHDNVKVWPCVRSYYVCGYYKLYAYGDDNAYDNNNSRAK